MYQNSLDIIITILYSDDHEVIIVREDSNDVTLRESDADIWFFPIIFGGFLGYYVCSQHLPGIFPLGGVGSSFVDETSSHGLNHGF